MTAISGIDFAISYAGEDAEVARIIANRLRELGLGVFLADDQRRGLVGEDGEAFFERLFTEATQVVALVSQHYRAKEWTRFEWDVIRERDLSNRYIPVRLDDTKILGLASNVIYVSWSQGVEEVTRTCVERLLLYERDVGISRPSMYERILSELQEGSRGSLAKAFQLMVDGRERDPLADAAWPTGPGEPQYSVVEDRWHNYSKVRRRAAKVRLPGDLSREEILYSLKCCCINLFNDAKPDAVSVLGYSEDADLDGSADLAIVDFAPFGDWGRAEEGLAYNLPTSEFEFRVTWMQGPS